MNCDRHASQVIALLPVIFALSCSTPAPLPALGQVEKVLAKPMVLDLLSENRPVVIVQFPGTTESGIAGVPMLVDSGASITVLSKTSAEELGLHVALFDGVGKAQGSGGGDAALTHYAAIDHLRVGDISVPDFHVAVLDSAAIDGEDFIGILGQDFFGAFPTMIDMQGETIHFLPANFRQEEISAYLSNETNFAGDWFVNPAEFEPRPFMDFSYTVDDQEHDFSLGIDTGAVSTSMPVKLCTDLKLKRTGEGTRTGIDGAFQVAEYEMHSLPLGSFRVKLTVAESKLEQGMLGMDVLSGFVLILDGPSERVWFLRQGQDAGEGE